MNVLVAERESTSAPQVTCGEPPGSGEEHEDLHHPLEVHAERLVAHLFDDEVDRIAYELFEHDFVREDRSSLLFPPADLAGFREAATAIGDGSPRVFVAVRSWGAFQVLSRVVHDPV